MKINKIFNIIIGDRKKNKISLSKAGIDKITLLSKFNDDAESLENELNCDFYIHSIDLNRDIVIVSNHWQYYTVTEDDIEL